LQPSRLRMGSYLGRPQEECVNGRLSPPLELQINALKTKRLVAHYNKGYEATA